MRETGVCGQVHEGLEGHRQRYLGHSLGRGESQKVFTGRSDD